VAEQLLHPEVEKICLRTNRSVRGFIFDAGVGHTTSANVDAGDDIKAVGSVQHSSPPALPGGFTGFALVVLLQAKNMSGRAFCPKETFTNLVQPMWLGLAWLGLA